MIENISKKPELLFEKEYELLQEIEYPYKGTAKKTRNIVLKAPTFKESEKIEAALNQLMPVCAIINFICQAGLISTKEDNFVISSPILLENLHILAYRHLANSYCKFFLTSDTSEEEKKFTI